MTSYLTVTAFSRPASIYGTGAIEVAPESPETECGSDDTLLAGECWISQKNGLIGRAIGSLVSQRSVEEE